MNEQDKIAFKQMMIGITNVYNKPALERDQLRIWWAKLERYDVQIVMSAFDKFTSHSVKFPTPVDIIDLCKAPKIEYTQLTAPKLNKEQNREYADNLVKAINEQIYEDKKDWKAWAKKIMANPKSYPAISIEFAKEALRVN
jgi:hypothetical protein